MGPSKDYKVIFTIADSPERHETIVSIIQGLTTVEDIPQILAVKRTGNQSDRVFIHVQSTEEIPSESETENG